MKYILRIFLLFLLVITFPGYAYAEIVLEEDFDNWGDYYSNQCPPNPWCNSCGCDGNVLSVTIDDITHSPTEVTGPGWGNFGKSMKTWRNGMT